MIRNMKTRNRKKLFELTGLYLLYCLLFGFLIMIIGLFSWHLYVLTYGLGCVIMYVVFIEPIWALLQLELK